MMHLDAIAVTEMRELLITTVSAFTAKNPSAPHRRHASLPLRIP
jgi:hypothetical protein